ncbi:MAG TPA: maleylpyruvate isomerase N-terminal domain-containing protein [Actinomycetes bacterium]|nr:maleylpyruvate isomerase N-terminal domain-containing protein [Actinomycetes bacterium]
MIGSGSSRRTTALLDVLAASHARLRELVEPLAEAELDRPAYPREWCLAQVVSHLGSSAEVFGLFLDAGLEERPLPGLDRIRPVWAAWGAKPPADAVRDALVADQALLARFSGLGEQRREAWRLHMWDGDTDYAGLLRMRLFEHTVHSWDVAVALDPGARLAGDAVPLLVDHLGPITRRTALPHEPARIRVDTTDPDRVLLLDLGETGDMRAWDSGEVQGRLRMPAEALIRLVYGRLATDHAVAVDPVWVDLDGLELADLVASFSGP